MATYFTLISHVTCVDYIFYTRITYIWVTHALMLLAFTARRVVRSAHLALYPIRFTAQFDFVAPDRYLVRRDGLISALVTTSSPRLKARA